MSLDAGVVIVAAKSVVSSVSEVLLVASTSTVATVTDVPEESVLPSVLRVATI